MASIVKRARSDGSEVWRVAYRRDGRLCWTPTIATGEGAAEMKELVERLGPDAAVAILRQRTGRDVRHMPLLAEVFERHIEAVAAVRTSGTVGEYRRMAARTWLPSLGPLPVDAITRDTCVAWVAWQRVQLTRRGKPYATKSIVNAARLLSSVMASAVEAGLVPRNPAARLPIPSDQERAEMVVLTHNEYARLVAAIPERWHPLVAFLAGTGCRWGEATALRPGDFDLDADEPMVRISRAWKKADAGVYLGGPKSRKGVRTVSLGRVVVDAVRPLVEAADRDGLVFTAVEGGRVSAQRFHTRVWKPALEAARLGKRPRVHDLRHTHASWQIAAGIRPEVLQRRLGHESIKTTYDVYGHLLPDSHAGAADAADRAMAGAHPELVADAPLQIAP